MDGERDDIGCVYVDWCGVGSSQGCAGERAVKSVIMLLLPYLKIN